MVVRPIRQDKSKLSPCSLAPSGDEFTSWSAPPPMVMSRQDPLNLPFQHYAVVYLDQDGSVKTHASRSIGSGNRNLFTPKLKMRFLETAGIRPPSRSPPGASRLRLNRRASRDGGDTHTSSHSHLSRNGDPTIDEFDIDMDPEMDAYSSDSSYDYITIEIGDTEKILAFYDSAFRALQQLCCRQIAKAFIKVIEPRKQVKHPYNGGKPPPGSAPGEKGDPEKTKPDWWPSLVTHKEPDHLKKPERIRLLIHLFRELGRSYNFPANKLREAEEEARRQLKCPQRAAILEEIIRIRRREESYERGEMDSNTLVSVINRDRSNARMSRDSETPEPDQASDSGADMANGQQTPMGVGPAAPLNTPVHYMGAADRSQTFPINYQYGVQDQIRSTQSFTSPEIKQDYMELESQSITGSRTPVTVASGEQGIDYLSHAGFVPHTTAPEHTSYHHQAPLPSQHQPNGQYNPWPVSFQANGYNSVDYGAQAMPHQQSLPQQHQHVQMLQNGLPHPQQTQTGHNIHNPRP
ncbi:hypothetical protein FQN54_001704 [Arachnomyces sp. PD_36]|nr:hypothetical protein FQN54_001704 [Arachnomyces sp. PD_36]